MPSIPWTWWPSPGTLRGAAKELGSKRLLVDVTIFNKCTTRFLHQEADANGTAFAKREERKRRTCGENLLKVRPFSHPLSPP